MSAPLPSAPAGGRVAGLRTTALRAGSLLRMAVSLVWGAAPRAFTALVALTFVSAAFAALTVYAGKLLLDGVLAAEENGSVSEVVLPLLLLAGAQAGASLIGSVSALQTQLLGVRVQRSSTQRLLEVCAGVDLESYESSSFFERLQRVRANAISRPVTVVTGLIQLISGVVTSLVLVAALLRLAPSLVPLLFVAGVPLLVVSRIASRREFAFATQQNDNMRERSYLEQVLTSREGAKELRAFDLHPWLGGRWGLRFAEFLEALGAHIRFRTLLSMVGNLASALVVVLTLLLLVSQVAAGTVTIASAGAALIAVRLLGARVQQTAGSVGAIMESGLFLADLDRFFALAPPFEPRDPDRVVPPFAGVEARGLEFSYPGAPTPALRGVDLSIAPGQVVALVGENGSGKTTLAKLLGQLYRPTGGSLLWGGVDVAELDPVALRDQVATIFQDFVKYALSVEANIQAGRWERADGPDAVQEAARRSRSTELIESLPLGYATPLSTLWRGGRDLSVGQWQRIALARALYRDAPFVILDEPTSAMDPKAEHALFADIRTLLGGRAVLLISHRFSSVRTADIIYVLRDGLVVERGSHAELMAARGYYAELFTLQASAYLDDARDAGRPAAQPTGT